MTQNNSEPTEKSTSEAFSEIWRQLSHNQRRFVVAMRECVTKADGARLVDLEPDTIYRWPDIVDAAIDLMDAQVKDAAVEILADSVAKAAMIKVGGLDSEDERMRQDSASEVLDRALGKPTQRQEVGGIGGGAIVIDDKYTDDQRVRGLVSLLDAVRAGLPTSDPDE